MARPAVRSARPGSAHALRRTVRWLVPAVLVLAVVVWFAVRAGTASGTETNRYATAVVSTGTVTETYTGSGTVAKIDQATSAFPASGTVTEVNVKIGDKVSAGDVLASIDNTALKLAVIEAKQTLADAQVTLDNAQAAADAAASASASPSASASATATARAANPAPSAASSPEPTSGTHSSSPPRGGTGGGGGSPGTPGGGPPRTLAQLTAALHAAQARLAELNAASNTALAAEQTSCAALSTIVPTPTPSASDTATPSGTPSATVTPSASDTTSASPSTSPGPSDPASDTASPRGTPSATDTPSATPSSTPSPTPPPSRSPVASADPASITRCIAAVVDVQQHQGLVAVQQSVVDQAVAAVVAKATSTSGQTGGNGGGTTTGSNGGGNTSSGTSRNTGSAQQQTQTNRAAGGTGSTGQTGSGGGQGGQGVLTVASAEAAATKADLALTTAETQLGAATMRAPISGVVAALPYTKGQTAAASDQAVIIGKGSVRVVMNVPEAAFRTLKAGQAATITTPGGGRASGKVTLLALLPTESTSGSTTFPVTVTATGKGASTLPAGAIATVAVRLATSDHAVVVPVSAVTRNGASGVVEVLTNGVPTPTTVTLGAIGTATVEVTSGLNLGQTVVLADNQTALPTNSSNRGLGGGGGGFGGGAVVQGGGGGAPPGGR